MAIKGNYENDSGKRKELPHSQLKTIPHMPFEEYSEILKGCIKMKRERGILEARMHTNGGPVQWSAELHQGLHYFFDWAGRDPDNEVIILGGIGPDTFKGIGRTDENGKITIDKLPVGKYYILEKEAPEGYKINEEKMYFEITEDGQVVKCNMLDEAYEVPNTGLSNINYELIGSLVLIVSGLGLFLYGTKKRK